MTKRKYIVEQEEAASLSKRSKYNPQTELESITASLSYDTQLFCKGLATLLHSLTPQGHVKPLEEIQDQIHFKLVSEELRSCLHSLINVDDNSINDHHHQRYHNCDRLVSLILKCAIHELEDNNDIEDLSQCILQLEKAESTLERNLLVYFLHLRGYRYACCNKYHEALSDYSSAINLNGTLGYLYYNRGCLYHERGRNDESVLDFTKAIDIDPSDGLTCMMRGNVYQHMNEHENACKDYERFMQIDGMNATVCSCLGFSLYKMKLYDQAIEYYNKAISLDANHADTYIAMGNIYQDMNVHDAAIKYYDKSLELDNNNPKAYNNRGFSKNLQDKFDEAIEDYKMALEKDKNYVCTWFNLSAVLYRQKRIVEALSAVKVAFLLDSSDERYQADYQFFLRMIRLGSTDPHHAAPVV